MKIKVRQLKQTDNLALVSQCDELNFFFSTFAKKSDLKNYLGTIYVAVIRNKIVGFISLSINEIKFTQTQSNFEPIVRLTRLAVDKKYLSLGVGKSLLSFAIKLTLAQTHSIGLFVDTHPKAVDFYQQFGFKKVKIYSGYLDVKPFLDNLFLSTKTIQE